MTDDKQTLFNCMPDGEEPVWTAFTTLRIGGCVDHGGETEGLVDYQRAEFFTVYGVMDCGECAAITDVPTVSLIRALGVANTLAERSGLRLTVCAFLFPTTH